MISRGKISTDETNMSVFVRSRLCISIFVNMNKAFPKFLLPILLLWCQLAIAWMASKREQLHRALSRIHDVNVTSYNVIWLGKKSLEIIPSHWLSFRTVNVKLALENATQKWYTRWLKKWIKEYLPLQTVSVLVCFLT